MRSILYKICQCTWGIVQSLIGFIVLLINFKNKHFWYHGALVTVWESKTSISLGLFVFITSEPFFAKKYEDVISVEELSNRLLVHEYGHTIQSLILGPLYLLIIGIPSTLWGFLGGKKRKDKQIPYGSFFTERWANYLGELVTGEKSIGDMVLE